jgi:hypothetical protein
MGGEAGKRVPSSLNGVMDDGGNWIDLPASWETEGITLRIRRLDQKMQHAAGRYLTLATHMLFTAVRGRCRKNDIWRALQYGKSVQIKGRACGIIGKTPWHLTLLNPTCVVSHLSTGKIHLPFKEK